VEGQGHVAGGKWMMRRRKGAMWTSESGRSGDTWQQWEAERGDDKAGEKGPHWLSTGQLRRTRLRERR
jgi:hypothetical protein